MEGGKKFKAKHAKQVFLGSTKNDHFCKRCKKRLKKGSVIMKAWEMLLGNLVWYKTTFIKIIKKIKISNGYCYYGTFFD